MYFQGVSFAIQHALVSEHYGRAMKILLKQIDDKYTKELDDRLSCVSKYASKCAFNYANKYAPQFVYRNNMYRVIV